MGLLLFSALWLLYQQTFTFDYVYFDDDLYVLDRPFVLAGLTWEGVRWAITSFEHSNWHPLTWVSHMLDVSLFGTHPGWAHAHNALLHGINSLLVYLLLLRYGATLLPAALLGGIFLLHPLHVESVAWIAERKDLLCALFYLSSLLCYDTYRRRGSAAWYLATLGSGVLALLAKPMAVSLPVVLVLLDLTLYRGRDIDALWQPTRIAAAVRRHLPLACLTAGACVLTLMAQDGSHAIAYVEAHSLTDRLETAMTAYLVYLRQWLVPVNLVAFYPLSLDGSLLAWAAPAVAVIALCLVALASARRWPMMTLGWAWYVVTLLPVIGLVQVGSQAHADRYMYLPSIGLLLIAMTLFPRTGSDHHRGAVTITCVYSVFLGALCYWQVATWKNEFTVFSRVLDIEGPNYKSHIHLASFFLRHNDVDKAYAHASAGLALEPTRSDAYQALGNIALARGEFAAAEHHLREALARGPALDVVYNNLGIALAQQGKGQQARTAFNEALRINPALQVARDNLERQAQTLEAPL